MRSRWSRGVVASIANAALRQVSSATGAFARGNTVLGSRRLSALLRNVRRSRFVTPQGVQFLALLTRSAISGPR